MMRLAFLLAALPLPALADSIEMRQGQDHIELVYENFGQQNSVNGIHRHTFLGVTVDVQIIVSGGENGAETIIVSPVDGMVMADPPQADVLDGDGIVILLVKPMF